MSDFSWMAEWHCYAAGERVNGSAALVTCSQGVVFSKLKDGMVNVLEDGSSDGCVPGMADVLIEKVCPTCGSYMTLMGVDRLQ